MCCSSCNNCFFNLARFDGISHNLIVRLRKSIVPAFEDHCSLDGHTGMQPPLLQTHIHDVRGPEDIFFLVPKWGRVCRVFNTRNCDFNPLTGDHFGQSTYNRDFNPLTGDASYALYTHTLLNVPAGSFLEYALNISNMSKM